MRYVTFALLFKYEQGLMFLIQEILFILNVKALSHQRIVMNKLLSKLSKVILLICMAELDHQRSAAKTLVDKTGLDTFVLFNIIIAGLRHILSLHFTVLINFDEY